ncbi:MAG: hypothetical protein ACI8QS_001889 [Planctomycetota bacterium]|jgi:hypothetical protein
MGRIEKTFLCLMASIAFAFCTFLIADLLGADSSEFRTHQWQEELKELVLHYQLGEFDTMPLPDLYALGVQYLEWSPDMPITADRRSMAADLRSFLLASNVEFYVF